MNIFILMICDGINNVEKLLYDGLDPNILNHVDQTSLFLFCNVGSYTIVMTIKGQDFFISKYINV